MSNPVKLAAIGLAAVVIAACSGTSSTNSVLPTAGGLSQMSVTHGGGVAMDLSHVHVMGTVANHIVAGAHPDIQLNYYGGPVEPPGVVYVVYWGFGKSGSDPSGEQKYLTNFLKGVGGSKWENINSQYYQKVGSKKTFIKNNTGMLKGTWVDKSAIPTAPSDAQIQAEAQKAMAHFGFNKNASYVVATSHSHNSPGFGSSYCAYHGASNGSKGIISYTNLPYMTDAGANCGESFINPGSKGLLDGVSIVEGHEFAESRTDPQPPTAWYNPSYGEIGDICAWMKPPAGNIKLSTGTFAVQGLFDNKKSACEISGP